MIIFCRSFSAWLLKYLFGKNALVIGVLFMVAVLAGFVLHGQPLHDQSTMGQAVKRPVVVIDPGHGGADPGAVVGDVTEADINMRLSEAVKSKLEQSGIKVQFTRQGDKGLVPKKKMSYFERWLILEKRKELAQMYSADVLISIHTNSNEDKTVSGPMVFFSDSGSESLAQKILAQLSQPGSKFKKVYASDFTVIKNNQMPSVLVEAGFITNRRDRNQLQNNNNDTAERIARGIVEFLQVRDTVRVEPGGKDD